MKIESGKAMGTLGGAAVLAVMLGYGISVGMPSSGLTAAPLAPAYSSPAPPPPSPPPPPPAEGREGPPFVDYGGGGGAPGGGGAAGGGGGG
ncbi:hypothetical protein [Mycobacterium sp. Lab-001]|uniref:hypothetical protein n=1 Tax=Mycobacterium sp. Lab-001 TaxID=3410136 RepID=UPI003D17DAEF